MLLLGNSQRNELESKAYLYVSVPVIAFIDILFDICARCVR